MLELKIGAAPRALDWMDWTIQLSAAYVQLIGILIWPLTLTVIVYGFRTPISNLIANVIKFSVGNAQFEFRQGLEIAEQNQAVDDVDSLGEASVEQPLPENRQQDSKVEESRRRTVSVRLPSDLVSNYLLLSDPASAIQHSWLDVEKTLRKINDQVNDKRRLPENKRARNPSARFIVNKLLKFELITEATAAMILEMDKLQSISSLQGQNFISREDAVRFLALTKSAISEMNKINFGKIKPRTVAKKIVNPTPKSK